MKIQTIFVCSKCDSQFRTWTGRCSSCGAWNTLSEQSGISQQLSVSAKPLQTAALSRVDAARSLRQSTGLPEFDQILGGKGGEQGLVPGSLVLLGGDPGIGKSTLSLQLALSLANRKYATLYVSGEESLSQIKLRAERISLALDKLQVVSENKLDRILATVEASRPKFLVIDSIQTMYTESIAGVAGGVAQVSAATGRILEMAKSRSIATAIIGHVTKEGNLAGPRMLEHMVDVVLYLEGERDQSFRILRCIKNRFGATDEVAVLEMGEQGLTRVENPSRLFLSQRASSKPGSVITCTVEGSRAMLLEVQALTARSQFNYPKRTASGFDLNRLQLIAAVLQKTLKLPLFSEDIFVSVAGGYRIFEPACDLAITLAIASSFKNSIFPSDSVAVGEVGLSGEIRSITRAEKRVSEAAKMGFKRIILPAGNKTSSSGIKVVAAGDLREAVKNF